MIRRIRIAALSVKRLYHWHRSSGHDRNEAIRKIEARIAAVRETPSWLSYLIRREKWVHHPEDGTWHKGGALIEQRNNGFWLFRDYKRPTQHATLREAIEHEAADK